LKITDRRLTLLARPSFAVAIAGVAAELAGTAVARSSLARPSSRSLARPSRSPAWQPSSRSLARGRWRGHRFPLGRPLGAGVRS